MTSTLPRTLGAAVVVMCCATAFSAVAGCSRTIDGTPAGGTDTLSAPQRPPAPIPLPQLVLDPTEFPPGYPATTLGAVAAQRALATLEGIPEGAHVVPADCVPAAPGEVSAAEAVDDDTTLRVVLARGGEPMTARRDQLGRCPSFSVSDADGASEVSLEMLPPPALDVDDAFALEQTQTGTRVASGLTFVAQVGDVRVMAQLVGPPGQQLDAAALDAVFTAAVKKVRRAA